MLYHCLTRETFKFKKESWKKLSHHSYLHDYRSSILLQCFNKIVSSKRIFLFPYMKGTNFATPWIAAWPSFPVLHYLLEFAQIHVHWSLWCYLIILSPVALFSNSLLQQHMDTPLLYLLSHYLSASLEVKHFLQKAIRNYPKSVSFSFDVLQWGLIFCAMDPSQSGCLRAFTQNFSTNM